MRVYIVEDFADGKHWRPTDWQFDAIDPLECGPGSHLAARAGLKTARKQYPGVPFRVATYERVEKAPSPKRKAGRGKR